MRMPKGLLEVKLAALLLLGGGAVAAALTPPSQVTATPLSGSEIQISWTDTNSSETAYVIERSSSPSGGFSAVGKANASFRDAGLARATTYFYRVFAVANSVESIPSPVVSATTFDIASTPTPTATPYNPFSKPAKTPPAGSTQTPTPTQPTPTPTATATPVAPTETPTPTRTPTPVPATQTPTPTPVPATQTPTPTPTAIPATATPTATPTRTPTPVSPTATPTATPTPIPPPAAPSALSATAASSSQINLAWSDNSSNETGFRVERSPATGGPWTQIASTGAASFADTGLAPSTAYFYRVRAYGPSGDSAYSNTASATTPAGTPAAPSNLTASSVSSRIDLGWADNSGNETAFKLERSTAASGWAQIATPAANATTYSDTGLAASTAYSYRLRAFNTAGDSAFSNTASASTGAAAGAHVWSRDMGGAGAMDSAVPQDLAVDNLGEVAVAGYFANSVNLGTGTVTSFGLSDIFVAKYSAAGTPLWARQAGSSQDDRAKGVAVDGTGNVLVTGLFRGTVDFGGGGIAAAANAVSCFVAKYSPTGAHLWSKRLSSALGLDEGMAIATDASGNVFVAGMLYQTSNFGGANLTSAGSADVFLVKLTPTGAHLWSKRFGGSAEEFVYDLAVDGNGNPAITGHSTGSADFGGGTLAGAGARDIFVAKYSGSDGSHGWSRRVGGSTDDVGRAIAFDGAGEVVVTGNFSSASVNFGSGAVANSGGADIFLAKYASDGTARWSKRFGSSLSLDEKSFGVAADSAGNIFLTGSVVDAIDFGGGALPGDGYYDIFIARFGSGGGHLWSKRTGAGAGAGVAADASGNVVGTGNFSGSTTVNFGGSDLTSPGGTDGYLVKLGP